jgi:hypothetical protein
MYRVRGEFALGGERDVLGFIGTRRREKRIHDLGVSTLHQAALRLADFRRGGSLFKTRDLVSLLLSHGARSWRASQPFVAIHIRVSDPQGRAAIRFRLQP